MIKTIRLVEKMGPICTSGEEAVKFLKDYIIPLITSGNEITFDCDGIRNMNDSFSNALFANMVMQAGPAILDSVSFINCRQGVRLFISTSLELGLQKTRERIQGSKKIA
jgi:hypothetical protein